MCIVYTANRLIVYKGLRNKTQAEYVALPAAMVRGQLQQHPENLRRDAQAKRAHAMGIDDAAMQGRPRAYSM